MANCASGLLSACVLVRVRVVMHVFVCDGGDGGDGVCVLINIFGVCLCRVCVCVLCVRMVCRCAERSACVRLVSV